MPTKRDQQQNIQAWFSNIDDPENVDLEVLQIFDDLRAEGWSPRKIIGTGILALKDAASGSQPRSNTVGQKLSDIMAAVVAIQKTLEAITIVGPAEPEPQPPEPKQFSALGLSMAGRYHPQNAVDDDDEEE